MKIPDAADLCRYTFRILKWKEGTAPTAPYTVLPAHIVTRAQAYEYVIKRILDMTQYPANRALLRGALFERGQLVQEWVPSGWVYTGPETFFDDRTAPGS